MNLAVAGDGFVISNFPTSHARVIENAAGVAERLAGPNMTEMRPSLVDLPNPVSYAFRPSRSRSVVRYRRDRLPLFWPGKESPQFGMDDLHASPIADLPLEDMTSFPNAPAIGSEYPAHADGHKEPFERLSLNLRDHHYESGRAVRSIANCRTALAIKEPGRPRQFFEIHGAETITAARVRISKERIKMTLEGISDDDS